MNELMQFSVAVMCIAATAWLVLAAIGSLPPRIIYLVHHDCDCRRDTDDDEIAEGDEWKHK